MVGYTVSTIVFIMHTGKIDKCMCVCARAYVSEYSLGQIRGEKILYLEHTPGMHGDFLTAALYSSSVALAAPDPTSLARIRRPDLR